MTRERKMAIKQWTYIWKELKKKPDCYDVTREKEYFCNKYHLDWVHSCWFCQYVRKDYRPDLPSRAGVSRLSNKCDKCPIFKYEAKFGRITHENQCACTVKDGLFYRVQCRDAKAAAEIIKLLGGEVK